MYLFHFVCLWIPHPLRLVLYSLWSSSTSLFCTGMHLCALPTLDGFSFQWMLQLISMQTTPYSSYSWWKLIFLWLRGLFVQHALFMPSSFCFVIAPSLLTSIHCLDARGLRAFFFRSQSDVLGLSYTDMVNCSVCRACVTIICQRHKTRSLFFHDVIALSTSFSALGLW